MYFIIKDDTIICKRRLLICKIPVAHAAGGKRLQAIFIEDFCIFFPKFSVVMLSLPIPVAALSKA
jgi:hypothetical protein